MRTHPEEERRKAEASADRAAKAYGVEVSITGMYRVTDSEDIEPPMNVCGVCLFCEDDPNNYGDTIAPTAYDGDCDECGHFWLHEPPMIEALSLLYSPADHEQDDKS